MAAVQDHGLRLKRGCRSPWPQAIRFSLAVNFHTIAMVKERLVRHEGRRTSRRLDAVAKIMVGTGCKVQDRGVQGERINPLFRQRFAITLGD